MSRQDNGVREPRIRLRRLLVLMRLLAGRRGHAQVVWRGAGFTYTLHVQRQDGPGPIGVDIDFDPTALDLTDILERVSDALYIQP